MRAGASGAFGEGSRAEPSSALPRRPLRVSARSESPAALSLDIESVAPARPIRVSADGGSVSVSPSELHSIEPVTAEDLDGLLPLMRAYCDFYRATPSDEALLELSRALISDPERDGVQLIARDERAVAVGFATIFWSWSTAQAGRIGVMNDLYVAPDARGSGLAERLIHTCVERCAQRGACALEWQTAPENARAQSVYGRVGAVREQWLTYTLAIPVERARAERPGEKADTPADRPGEASGATNTR
jgi:GNAT superfamily N-acetyltransferase